MQRSGQRNARFDARPRRGVIQIRASDYSPGGLSVVCFCRPARSYGDADGEGEASASAFFLVVAFLGDAAGEGEASAVAAFELVLPDACTVSDFSFFAIAVADSFGLARLGVGSANVDRGDDPVPEPPRSISTELS